MSSPSSDVRPALTSAGALHEILESLAHTESDSIASAWSQVLEAQWGSVEFSLRHSEVVRLWNDAIIEIKALNSERTKERILSYAVSWWIAVVAPKVPWEGSHRSAEVVNQAGLDQLGTAADLISAQLHGAALADVTPALSGLRAQCAEWIGVLEITDEITDEALRRTLLSQVEHLIWLLDNANRFGLACIVKNGDQLSGALVRVAINPAGQIKNRESFWERTKKLAATLAIISGLINSSNTMIEAARDSVPAIENVIHKITELGEATPPDGGTVIS